MKKIAFGMMFKNESFMLKRNLPKLPDVFHTYTFVDTGSTDDSCQIIEEQFGLKTIHHTNKGGIDEGFWRQVAINQAERDGCDWILILDADEALLPEDYAALLKYAEAEENTVYSLSRIEFVNDENHFISESFPDPQVRFFKLNMGYYYAPWFHSTVYKDGNTAKPQFLPQIRIFHYGGIKNHRERWLHYYNAELQQKGIAPVAELPLNYEVPKPYWEQNNYPINTFYGEQP